MIAAWMLFATMLGLLFGLAAMAAEPLLAARRRPRRAAWLAAMLLTIVWPAAALARHTIAPSRAAPLLGSPLDAPLARASAYVTRASAGRFAAHADSLLLGAWAAATTLLLLRLRAGRRRLERARRNWGAASVNGMSVRLSEEIGPAVVGLRPMEIVLPQWALALDQPLRDLVLRHEEEHRVARDPHVLFLAALAVALAPWNVALWWQARRLRLAIEIDCDTRVLRAHPRSERYGMLLLAIAQRRSTAPLLAPALSEPVPDLERRIVAMRTTTTARSRLVAQGASAVLLLAIACSLGAPTDSSPPPPAPAPAPPANDQGAFREFRLTKKATPLPSNVPPRYPDELREAKVEGEVLLRFVVDPSGRVDMGSVKVLRSTDPRFTAAVQGALSEWHFAPAEIDGKRVKQQLEMPFQFALRLEAPKAPPR